ncbi:MAG TPA: hypothetical protein VH722_07775 [Alphaproteobacteria bacterium]|jgi:hypothetical protein|nr:hypothetical protein [Alphaproteobacteria bacterium]
MSMPIFFQRYQNGEAVSFKRSEIATMLGSAAVMHGPNVTAIRFSDADGGEVYGVEADEFEQLSFDEGMGEKFFDALWRIADATGAFIYWLGDGACSAVTRGDVLPHLPPDVVADVGPVKIVGSGAEIEGAIYGGDFDFDD